MYDLTDRVEVVETDETLASDLAAQVDRNLRQRTVYSLVLVPLDDFEQVDS